MNRSTRTLALPPSDIPLLLDRAITLGLPNHSWKVIAYALADARVFIVPTSPPPPPPSFVHPGRYYLGLSYESFATLLALASRYACRNDKKAPSLSILLHHIAVQNLTLRLPSL